jgi:hypothetical protein
MLSKASFRKPVLLLHVVSSVGWLGAVAAFLVLALTGLRGSDLLVVRSAYLVMEPVTWSIIVPLAFAALLTGLLLSLGTPWGLFRHYWILMKLLINLLSIVLLLVHTRLIHQVAAAAAATPLLPTDLRGPRTQLVIASIAALAALMLATLLSVYKPRGITPFSSD